MGVIMKNVDFKIDGKRYEYNWLTMKDFMGLYSKKHNWEKIYDESGSEEARKYLYSIVDELYPEVPEKYRMLVFISLIISSEGKNRIILTNECSKCHEEHHISLKLNSVKSEEDFSFEDVDGNSITIKFSSINYRNKENLVSDLYHNIRGVTINGTFLEWEMVAEESKMSLLSYIDRDTVETLLEKLVPCTISFFDAYGCDTIQRINNTIEVDDMKIFDWLVNKSEVNTIYQIATIMASNGINMTDYMNMAPFERREILKNIKANNELAGKE